jgi:hypothetical protein
MMTRWNHKVKNEASEAVKALDNAVGKPGAGSDIVEERVQSTKPRIANKAAEIAKAVVNDKDAKFATTADLDNEVYEGEVQLQITPFEGFSQIKKYRKYLAEIKDLKIVSESWSEDEGFSFIVKAQVPLALPRLLQNLPEVACVQLNTKNNGHKSHKQNNKKMLVVMKTSEVSFEPMPA